MSAVWVLVLTLTMGVDGGVAMHSVRMDSYRSCMAAAEAWLKSVNDGRASARHHMIRSAVCVEGR